jgi:CHAD domain-containing protein
VTPALRQVVRRTLRHAIAQLESGDAEAVHEARKGVKQARAAVKLLRAAGVRGLGKSDRQLQKAGGTLSIVRDAQVLRLTLDDVRADMTTPIPSNSLALIRRVLANRSRRVVRRASRDGDVKSATRRLKRVRRMARHWRHPRLSPDAIARAISASAHDARDAMRRARKSRQDADVHRWRRRTKTLYLQLRLLAPGAPDVQVAIQRLGELEAMLGDHQNLAVFRVAVLDEVSRGSITRAWQRVLDAAARRQQESLRRGAFALGMGNLGRI